MFLFGFTNLREYNKQNNEGFTRINNIPQDSLEFLLFSPHSEGESPESKPVKQPTCQYGQVDLQHIFRKAHHWSPFRASIF
jgi:hypothetical protein